LAAGESLIEIEGRTPCAVRFADTDEVCLCVWTSPVFIWREVSGVKPER
jgi:hypothetical protein